MRETGCRPSAGIWLDSALTPERIGTRDPGPQQPAAKKVEGGLRFLCAGCRTVSQAGLARRGRGVMTSLTYEAIATLFTPGAMIFLGAWAILDRFSPDGRTARFLMRAVEAEWRFTMLFFLVSLFLGSLLASALSHLEGRVLDPLCAKRLKIDAAQYEREWYRYVDSLREETRNPYLSRLVLFFFFEYRTGAAGVLLAIALLSSATDRAARMVCIIGIVLSIALIISGATAHHELAKYRHRKFE